MRGQWMGAGCMLRRVSKRQGCDSGAESQEGRFFSPRRQISCCLVVVDTDSPLCYVLSTREVSLPTSLLLCDNRQPWLALSRADPEPSSPHLPTPPCVHRHTAIPLSHRAVLPRRALSVDIVTWTAKHHPFPHPTAVLP